MSYSSDGRGLDVAHAPAPDERRTLKLRPLAGLIPYIVRYRGRAAAALAALIVASLTTLIVPVAVRRMIDFGFSDKAVQLIDSYFAVMILVVAVLAVSSALRFYLVTTLGERIVADLRSDVFAHLTRLSPAYFDARAHRRNCVSAHGRYDPDQIGRGRFGVDCAAQSGSVSWRRRHDGRDQSAAVLVRARCNSGDRAAARRLRACRAPAWPCGAGYARQCVRLCQ